MSTNNSYTEQRAELHEIENILLRVKKLSRKKVFMH